MFNSVVYRDFFSTPEMREIWSEKSTISAWLKTEKELAAAQAEMNIISSEAATALAAVTADDINLEQLAESMMLVGRPIVGLVNQLRHYVGSAHAASIHFGTTTQDIMDTATVLQMKEGFNHLFQLLENIIAKLELLAEQHTTTRMIGRSNGQFAIQISFGLKVQFWINELQRRIDAMKEASRRGFLVQFGGPVGNLSAFDEETGSVLRKKLATRLSLNSSALAWQNARDGLGDVVLSLGQLSTSLEKIGHNINLLSSSEISELYENPAKGNGASSSMAHKRNQRCSEFTEAIGRLVRGRAMQIGETAIHEHERSGGVWISEWVIIPEVFLLTSGALKWTDSLFSTLEVDKFRMDENLKLANELIDLRLSRANK
jgi:3-carboxy-cis,cis-muconate cycloisomerase